VGSTFALKQRRRCYLPLTLLYVCVHSDGCSDFILSDESPELEVTLWQKALALPRPGPVPTPSRSTKFRVRIRETPETDNAARCALPLSTYGPPPSLHTRMCCACCTNERRNLYYVCGCNSSSVNIGPAKPSASTSSSFLHRRLPQQTQRSTYHRSPPHCYRNGRGPS